MTPTPKQLEVWFQGEQVGVLTQVNGRLAFAYTAQWLQQAQADEAKATLSQSLPLRAEPFDDRETRPFFAGLLPEGDKRIQVAQVLQVSRQNDFALLDGIGGECAGAVTMLAPGQTPASTNTLSSVRWLDEPALAQLLVDLPKRPMLAGQDGLRLSLAGAQDKLPVVVQGEQVGLPLNGMPSTHILKPSIEGVEGSVFNEAFCMTLAAALKLQVAPVHIGQVAGQAYLLVQRYDREPSTPPQRLHQEDFCQALGIPPEHKYQNEGGPDLAQAFELLRRVTRPSAPHLLRMLDQVVFNALIGNHDAHGKNFSLLYTRQGPGLAPLYDALCTAVYPHLTEKMAMKLGSKYCFDDLMPRHWEQFALAAGLSPAQVKKRVLDLAKRLPALASQNVARFEAQHHHHPILGQIQTLIEQRCDLTLRRLTAPSAHAS